MARHQYYKPICVTGPLGLCAHFRPARIGGREYIPVHCGLTGKRLAGSEAYDGCVNHIKPKKEGEL